MTVYFIMRNMYPNGKASTARVRSYTKGLTEYGIECKVIIPISPERYGHTPINTIAEGYHENVYFKYITNSPQRKSNFIKRQISDIIGYIKTLLYLRKNLKKNDIVIIYEGGVLWHKIIARTVHSVHCKVVMELNEYPFVQTPGSEKKRKRMLNTVFPMYDGFLAISENLVKLINQYAPSAKVLKVPIIVESLNKDNLYIDKKKEEEAYIFHSGSLSEQKDGILGVIEAFGIACKQLNTPLKYYMTGNLNDSPHAEQIKTLINKYNLHDKIIFTGYLNENELRNYQKNCNLTIINKYDTIQNKYCFATKLGEYLALKRPVIITDVGEATFYLNDTHAYIVPHGSPQLIANKIIEIINNPQKSKQIAEEGYKLTLKEFNYRYQAQRIISFFNRLNHLS